MSQIKTQDRANSNSKTRLRVKELLRERRWPTKILSEKTGLSESYLTHLKNGTRRWNEDALRKLAEAFELEPTDLFAYKAGRTDSLDRILESDSEIEVMTNLLKMKIVPVVGEIPSTPNPFNNQQIQCQTGYADSFAPIFNSNDENLFCLEVQDDMLSPRFAKGDQLIISPEMRSKSGDIVAIEYALAGQEMQKGIRQINYMDDFMVIEEINHKNPPIALVRGKDHLRIIGKVIWRYQKL